MKRSIFFLYCAINIFSFDYPAYYPMEFDEFVELFETISKNNHPGLSIFGNTAVRIRAILHEFPKELDDNDILNIRYTLQSLGFNPNMVSEFGYKVEYVYPSNVEWQEETRLIFFIQNVQRQYFEKEYELNDIIYWFAVFKELNTFSQIGYFIVSDFLNTEQFLNLNIR